MYFVSKKPFNESQVSMRGFHRNKSSPFSTARFRENPKYLSKNKNKIKEKYWNLHSNRIRQFKDKKIF